MDLLSHSVKMHTQRWATPVEWTGQQRKATISWPRQEPEVRLWKVRLGKGIVVGRIRGLPWDTDFTSGRKDTRIIWFWKCWWPKEIEHNCLGWGAHQYPQARGGWTDEAVNVRQCRIQASQRSSLHDGAELLSSPNPQCITFGETAVFRTKTQSLQMSCKSSGVWS